MDYSQFLALKQEIGLLIAFLLVFFYDTFASRKAQGAVPVISCVLMGLVTLMGFCPSLKESATAFSGMYETNATLVAIKNILNVGALIVLIQSIKWANSEFVSIRRGEFYELIMLTLLGMYFMMSSRHFLMFIIGLETASLPLCALVAFDKNRYESHEAAIKYVLTAVFSSAILLMGLSLVYGLTGSLYYSTMAAMVRGNMSVAMVMGLAFLMAGFGFKLSLVPFHLWTADVYQGAPTSVTSYLSVISKGSAAFAFLVVLTQVFGTLYAQAWEWMLYALIILTITIGNLFAMRQVNMKRFLAFSSISQAGYIMLAIVGDNAMGVSALMFYVLVYVFSNLAAFGVIGAIENATGKVNMTDYNALYSTNPRLAFTMMLAMFSLAGIPPFAGFFSKFFVFTSTLNGAASSALYVLVLIALINTIISLYYYLLVVKAMFINPSDTPIATFRSACSERLGMWVCTAGIIGLGIISYFYDYLLTVVAA
ncbi:MAG: NADH-quinone oxidoreductase subunit N [Muribaculaceae bacterium]|nr:NADH-quinone oxidoreductase subunit N [Muribaculaceae bacterium]